MTLVLVLLAAPAAAHGGDIPSLEQQQSFQTDDGNTAGVVDDAICVDAGVDTVVDANDDPAVDADEGGEYSVVAVEAREVADGTLVVVGIEDERTGELLVFVDRPLQSDDYDSPSPAAGDSYSFDPDEFAVIDEAPATAGREGPSEDSDDLSMDPENLSMDREDLDSEDLATDLAANSTSEDAFDVENSGVERVGEFDAESELPVEDELVLAEHDGESIGSAEGVGVESDDSGPYAALPDAVREPPEALIAHRSDAPGEHADGGPIVLGLSVIGATMVTLGVAAFGAYRFW